jgi:hypothetical protein
MAISRDDALAALGEVQTAEARARTARSHRLSAPYLFLWGGIWVVGYTATGLFPGAVAGRMWAILGGAGVIANFVMSFRARRRGEGQRTMAILPFFGVAAFVFATYWIMRPTLAAQYLVFPPLLVSMIYMLVGGFRVTRLMWVGVALFALTVFGYAFLRPILPFYLAAVGGGGLILGGLWLRAA